VDDTARPTVTAIVPTRNRPDRLPRAVSSVIEQTYPEIELVVVDDGSRTPATATLAESAGIDPTDYSVLRHDRPRGANAARNTGIEAATGEILAFLDDDDEWEPTKLERQVNAFRDAEAVGVVYTGIRQVGTDGATNAVKTPDVEGDVTPRLLRGNFIGSFSAVAMRRAVVSEAGLLEEELPNWQDWEYYLRLSTVCQFGSVRDPLVRRHSGDHEQLSDEFESRRDRSAEVLLERYRPTAREYGYERGFEAWIEFRLAENALSNRAYGEARRHYARAVCRRPREGAFYPHLVLSIGGRYTVEPVRRAKRTLTRYLSDRRPTLT
jgi:glycosyltransferase involved in cell wall biosynthesis